MRGGNSRQAFSLCVLLFGVYAMQWCLIHDLNFYSRKFNRLFGHYIEHKWLPFIKKTKKKTYNTINIMYVIITFFKFCQSSFLANIMNIQIRVDGPGRVVWVGDGNACVHVIRLKSEKWLDFAKKDDIETSVVSRCITLHCSHSHALRWQKVFYVTCLLLLSRQWVLSLARLMVPYDLIFEQVSCW